MIFQAASIIMRRERLCQGRGRWLDREWLPEDSWAGPQWTATAGSHHGLCKLTNGAPFWGDQFETSALTLVLTVECPYAGPTGTWWVFL